MQTKPRIGPVDDPLEREADRVADAVVSNQAALFTSAAESGLGTNGAAVSNPEPQDTIQKQEERHEDEEPEDLVRLKAAGAASDDSAGSLAQRAATAVGLTGQPLGRDTRAYFEPRFGRDFSNVRIHTHAHARDASHALGARAFTLGRNIGFAGGEYAPRSPEGRRLLAHELAHVVQQDQGTAPGVPQFDGFRQIMRFNRRLRYRGGGFAPHNFAPDLRLTIREWVSDTLRVFTSTNPHNVITNSLVDQFEQLASDLGSELSLTDGSRYRFRGTVNINGQSITLSGISINGLTGPSTTSEEGGADTSPDDPRSRLTPELLNWHTALMASYFSFFSDGSEEFRAIFRTRSGAEPELLSWRRVSITEGRRRLREAQTPPSDFSRDFASSIELLLGFPGDEPVRREIVVRRTGRTWSTESVQTVPEPTTGGDPDSDLVLDRRALYGQILEDWRNQTQEAFTETTIMMASFAGKEIIFWYAGGAVLGVFGTVFRRLPLLRNLLTRRAAQPIVEAAGELGVRQGDEFIALWNRYVRTGSLPAAEMGRLGELATLVEARLAARTVARTMTRAEMQVFIEGLIREYPILTQLTRAQSLTGPAQRREMLRILDRFFRETGVAHEVVEDGVVQAARGAGNLASLRSSPGILQIERTAYESAEILGQEVTHELSFYYSGLRGRIPMFGESGLSAMNVLEMTIQNGGRFAL